MFINNISPDTFFLFAPRVTFLGLVTITLNSTITSNDNTSIMHSALCLPVGVSVRANISHCFLHVICCSTSKPPVIVVVGNKRDKQKLRFAPRHVLSVLVKKNWKCGYLECSARNNWHILLLFKELLISTTARSRIKTPSICLQGALHRERCSVM